MPALSTRRSKATPKALRKPARAKRIALPHPRYGITRIDNGATHGYFVRLGRIPGKSRTQPRFVTFFPDLRMGGKGRAFRAAKAWVLYVLRHGAPPKDQPSRRGRQRPTSRG